jgi:xanthine dehydrogenase accessory factor
MPYEEAFEQINISENSYIVIVTRGHMGDHDVLDLVLNSAATPAYIGMIGSVRKRNAIFEAMKVKGASEKKLSRIFCPVGLDIGAQTPEEIAISIIAEIIRVRSDKGKAASLSASLRTVKAFF